MKISTGAWDPSALHIYCISKNTNNQQPNQKVAVLPKGKDKNLNGSLAKGNAAERSKCIAASYYHCRLYCRVQKNWRTLFAKIVFSKYHLRPLFKLQ